MPLLETSNLIQYKSQSLHWDVVTLPPGPPRCSSNILGTLLLLGLCFWLLLLPVVFFPQMSVLPVPLLLKVFTQMAPSQKSFPGESFPGLPKKMMALPKIPPTLCLSKILLFKPPYYLTYYTFTHLDQCWSSLLAFKLHGTGMFVCLGHSCTCRSKSPGPTAWMPFKWPNEQIQG